MPSPDSADARAIIEAIEDLRDAVLFHAAYTTHPESFPTVQTQDENFISHGIKTAFRYFKQRGI